MENLQNLVKTLFEESIENLIHSKLYYEKINDSEMANKCLNAYNNLNNVYKGQYGNDYAYEYLWSQYYVETQQNQNLKNTFKCEDLK